jgi:hypothetical protein
MVILRILIAAIFAYLAIYTAIVISNHGWNLFPVFFGDMASMGWPGQFNSDFMGFLILSAAWLAWRNEFTPIGWLLAVCGFFGGIMFLAPYLFVMSYKCEGSMSKLLLGNSRG